MEKQSHDKRRLEAKQGYARGKEIYFPQGFGNGRDASARIEENKLGLAPFEKVDKLTKEKKLFGRF